ncbi:MAG: oligosaccharide flippase family protein [Flavobacteriales bacterium]|nr:oligosaccharide flippase family protein [Flavobacteriales bacterium]
MNILKKISVFTGVNVISSGISFLLLPVLTKYLSPEDYGVLSLFTAATSFIVALLSFGTTNIIMVKLYSEKNNFGSYFRTFLGLITLNMLITVVLFLLITMVSPNFMGLPKYLILFVPIVAIGVVFFETISTLMTYKKQTIKFALFSLFKFFIEIGLVILFVIVLNYTWKGRILALFLSLLVIGIFGYRYLVSEDLLKGKLQFVFYKNLLKEGSPLILMSVSIMVMNLSDRFYLEKMVGLKETGLYSVAYSIASIELLVIGASMNVFRPMIYDYLENIKENKKRLLNLSLVFILLTLGIFIIIAFSNEFIFKYFLEVSYESASIFVIPLTLSSLFWGIFSFYISYYLYYKKNRIIGLFSVIGIVINLVLNYYCILYYGAVGAAYATLITYFSIAVLAVIFKGSILKQIKN